MIVCRGLGGEMAWVDILGEGGGGDGDGECCPSSGAAWPGWSCCLSVAQRQRLLI